MFWKKSEYKSTAISVAIHLLIILLLMTFKITPEVDLNEYVTIGFGSFGKASTSGTVSKNEPKVEKKKKEKKKVELPKVKNVDETNKVVAAKKEKKEENKKRVEVEKRKKKKEEGQEENTEGEGNYGFELDFGGKGKRKIYSYSIPPYPSGVSKEIDVKLRFTIMPDGSVGRIIPLQKADTRLEAVAMNSLRQWRFEPLPEGQDPKPQSAAITFPFRLQ